MKTENTSTRLKKIMKDRNLRQVDILRKTYPYCEKYNVKMNKSDISQYVSGKVEPNQDKLVILGMALNVNEAWLMGYDVPMERNTNYKVDEEDRLYVMRPGPYPGGEPYYVGETPKLLIQRNPIKKIPVLGRISAGLPILAVENIESYENVEDEDLDYALIVKGDSMIGARIFEGDIVYVTKDAAIENGDIVIALINGEDATIKRFYKYDHEIILKPENPTMKEQHYRPEEVQILGKVKQVKFKL